MTKEDFLSKISERRKDKGRFYRYHLLPDKFLSSDKVDIECPLHGVFSQEVGNHIRNHSCIECAGKSVVTRDRFLEKAKCKLKGVDLDTLEFYGTDKNFKAYCYKHGWYEASAMNVYRGNRGGKRPGHGNGCHKCNLESKSNIHSTTREEFIEKFYENFPQEYTLKCVESLPERFNMMQDLVTAKCKLHGEITKTAKLWWYGYGCKKCMSSGFWLDKRFKSLEDNGKWFETDGFVYVSEIEDIGTGVVFYKIGITKNSAKTRVKYKPHKFVSQVSYPMLLGYAFYVEQSILNVYSECRYIASEEFEGWTECLSFNPSYIIEEIAEIL